VHLLCRGVLHGFGDNLPPGTDNQRASTVTGHERSVRLLFRMARQRQAGTNGQGRLALGIIRPRREGKAFSLSKGCYPGQEVVARMDTYGNVKRRLVGLVVESQESGVPPAHSKLFSGDRVVGWVSSASQSPTLNVTIALGFPLRDFSAPGTALEAEINGHRRPAVVRVLLFYTAG